MGAVRIFDKTVFRSQAELGNEGEGRRFRLPAPHLDHPLRGREMVEMVEMADIGGAAAGIRYMLWPDLVPISTTSQGGREMVEMVEMGSMRRPERPNRRSYARRTADRGERGLRAGHGRFLHPTAKYAVPE